MVKALGGGKPKSLWSGAGEGVAQSALVARDGDPPLRKKVRTGKTRAKSGGTACFHVLIRTVGAFLFPPGNEKTKSKI